jgi:hypothetical protein
VPCGPTIRAGHAGRPALPPPLPPVAACRETINWKPAAKFLLEADAQFVAFDAWVKVVAALPTAQQAKAVADKLQECNPDFDGKVTHKIVDDVVTELGFLTDNVTNIAPVRALSGLRTLRCNGSEYRKGRLADLSPLQS